MSLFGQILAALYQEDIVEEDDIRTWHSLSESKGDDRKSSLETENFKKCWVIGSHMIKQFDAQDSESEDETDEEDEQEKKKAEEIEKQKEQELEREETTTGTESEQTSEVETESEKETEEERQHKRRNTIIGPPAPAATLAVLPKAEKSDQGGLKLQNASLAIQAPSNANPPQASNEDSESDAYLTDSTEARDAGVSASEESTPANTEDEESDSD